jgi:hypothetical protein
MNPILLAVIATLVALVLAVIAIVACCWAMELRAELRSQRSRRRKAEARITALLNYPLAPQEGYWTPGPADLPTDAVAACIAELERHANQAENEGPEA